MRTFTLTAAVLGLLASLSAFAESPASKTRTLRVRNFGEPSTLDWNRAYTPVEATLVRNIQEGLVSIGKDLKVTPALAESWKISADGKTYVFNLRKGVKWSDGQILRAQDFVASWRRLLSPSLSANYAYLLFDVEGAEDFRKGAVQDFSQVGIKAVNDVTLEVKLRAPVPYWIWIPTFWATFPIRQDVIDKNGSAWEQPANMVNLGPFLLASHDAGKKLTLKKNPNYYGARGNVDEIQSAFISDDNLAAQQFEQGQIDFVTRISSQERTRYMADAAKKKNLVTWDELRTIHLDMNPNQAPTSNPNFRRAIAMALDRKLISKVVAGAYRPATSFIPPGMLAHDTKAGVGFDLKKAKLEFKKAGLVAVNGGPLTLVTAGFDDLILLAGFVKDELKKNLGLEVTVNVLEPKRFYSSTMNFGGYHMILTHWTADYPDPDNFMSIFLSSAGTNRVSWKNKKYDELVLKSRALTDVKERERNYRAAQKLLAEEDIIVHSLCYGRNSALVRPGIMGFAPSPTNSYLFKDFQVP